MNTCIKPLRQAGNALLVSLGLTTILALSVAGYLSYVEQQSFLSARAQAWNMAISISEAGVEEALEQLNSNWSNLSADGWTANGTTYYVTRNLAGGDSYTVFITNSSPSAPDIVSRAFVRTPTLAGNVSSAFYAAAGVNNPAPKNITRAVRVKTGRGSLLLGAMVAKHKIDMNGNNVATDSFDSGDITKSSNGLYDASKVGTYDSNHGDVASNDGVVNAVSVGNANIYGHVSTGPLGTVGVGSQGGIGTHEWQAAHGNAPQPGWISDNANFTFPVITLPYTSGLTATAGDVVSVVGSTTNQTAYNNMLTPPGPPAAGETIGPITTNTSYVTTSSYPGAKSGMVTNVSWSTTTTYPGAMPGLLTNCTGFTSASSAPSSSQMCSTTNNLGTTTTVTNYPGNLPGLVTNISLVTKQVTNCGASVTAASISSARCASSAITTNCAGGTVTTDTYPSSWCVSGGMTTNKTGNGSVKSYNYRLIGSYTYSTNQISTTTNTVYSYTYPNYSYTYATAFSYTYPTYTYTYPTFTYSYVIYTGVILYATNHYDHVLYSGNYAAPEGGLSGSTIVVGNAQLVMPNGLKMAGGDGLIIAASGSLKLYSGGTSLKVAGNGVINRAGLASKLMMYATTTVTDVSFSGNGEFTGVIIAPYADVKMNGGGHEDNDYIGAIMVNSITMNGHFKFHYDEALGREAGNGRFLITSWNEIP